jgi:hypothetical protein
MLRRVTSTASNLSAMDPVAWTCSETEVEMVAALPWICWMDWAMPWMSCCTCWEDFLRRFTWATISSMALVVPSERALTSWATTLKDRPWVPARAASMLALRASSLVWEAI